VSGALLLSVLANGLWQSAAVALVGGLAARLLVRRSAALRSAFWSGVLGTALLLPLSSTIGAGDHLADSVRVTTRQETRAPTLGMSLPIESRARPAGQAEEAVPHTRARRGSGRPLTAIATPVQLSERVVQIYALIVALLLGATVRDLVRMARVKRRAAPLPARIEVLLARCRREFGVRRRLRYGASAEIDTPVFVGLLQATLLLPRDSWSTLEERELVLIGAHELAHAQRRDDWQALAQRLALSLFFFNPAIRWICARLALEREMACDEWAVQQVGAAPDDFAGTLLRVAERTVSGQSRLLVSTALSGSCLSGRIRWLLSGDFEARHAPAPKRAAVALAGFGLVALAIGAAPSLDFVISPPAARQDAAVYDLASARAVDMAPRAVAQRLNDAFDGLAQAGFNGAVLVALQNQIVLHRGFGVSNRGSRTPVQPGTLFQAGAMAKMLTAAAILRLEEQGRLSIEDPLGKWLGPLPAPKDRITLHHLLVHASGLTPRAQPVYEAGELDFIAGLRTVPAEFEPGRGQRHSDIAYSALALVVQRASGMPYEEFVRTELLEPAGLRNTWFDPDAPRTRMAAEYRTTFDAASGVGRRPYVWGRRGAMAIVSNVEDLYRWQLALANLFTPEQRARMFDAGVANPWGSATGYGWETMTTRRGDLVQRRLSAWDGNSVELMHDPNHNLTIALFIDNRVDWDTPRYEAIAHIILDGDANGAAQKQLQTVIRNWP
jgi:CubicO group peptidase (beta-lactamase class C family)